MKGLKAQIQIVYSKTSAYLTFRLHKLGQLVPIITRLYRVRRCKWEYSVHGNYAVMFSAPSQLNYYEEAPDPCISQSFLAILYCWMLNNRPHFLQSTPDDF